MPLFAQFETTCSAIEKPITTTHTYVSHICRTNQAALDQGLGKQDSLFVRKRDNGEFRVKLLRLTGQAFSCSVGGQIRNLACPVLDPRLLGGPDRYEKARSVCES